MEGSKSLKKKESRTERLMKYLEVFTIPEIWWQPLPKYHISLKGNMFSLKSILFPDSRSSKKYTRKNQLIHRSLQAKIFDSLINIGYFDPLVVVKEFPIVIQNRERMPGQKGSFYLADYFFPTVLGGRGLVVELDSEYHHPDSDGLRDQYLQQVYGLQTFRMRNFDRADVQRGKFKELCTLLRSEPPSQSPRVLDFSSTIKEYINAKILGKSEDQEITLISDEDINDDFI